MSLLAGYFFIGFTLCVVISAYHQLRPLSDRELSSLDMRFAQEQRGALLIGTFLIWPAVLFVGILWGIIIASGLLAKWILGKFVL